MPRPISYKRLDSVYRQAGDKMVLGSESMYAVRRGNYFITTAVDQSTYTDLKGIKYTRLWFNSRKQAENAVQRLNNNWQTDEFEVVEITL